MAWVGMGMKLTAGQAKIKPRPGLRVALDAVFL